MKTYFLRNWNKKHDVYKWESKQLSKTVEHPEETDGYFKEFLLGKNIVVYREGDGWAFCIDGGSFSIEDINDAQVSRFGIFTTLKMEIDGKEYKFTEMSAWDYFSALIDPTYDNMDAEEVFSNWFLGVNEIKETK